MTGRKAICIASFRHKNPIPNACRIGGLVMSGIINGVDPETGVVADGIDAQCRFMFLHMRHIVEAAGGTPDDIIKMTVWLSDRSSRDALNREWLIMFPDEVTRPARHTLQTDLDGALEIQCDFTALLGSMTDRQ